MGTPEPAHLDVQCPQHGHQKMPGCPLCPVSADVQVSYHNEGRCIPATCPYLPPHHATEEER